MPLRVPSQLRSFARWGLLLALGWAAWPASSGLARTDETFAHRYEDIWKACVRLLVVDLGLAVRERDADVGFLIFDYVDHGRAHRGSLELVALPGKGRGTVRVVIHVADMPRYVERMILTKLVKKLSREYGEPPPEAPPEAKPAPEPPPSAEPAPEPDLPADQ